MALTQIKPAGLSKPVDLADNEKIRLGTGNDLEIFHNGYNSKIADVGTGALILSGSTVKIENSASSENLAVFNENGSIELYHDNSKKLETTSTGATVTGHLNVTDISSDSASARIYLQSGNTADSSIYFGRANDSATAALRYEHTTNALQLWGYNNSLRAEINSAGNLRIPNDSGKITCGTGDDLELYHDGSHSYLKNTGTGHLYIIDAGIVKIQSESFKVDNANGTKEVIKCNPDAGIELFYNNSKKFETTSSGTLMPDDAKAIFGAGEDLQISHTSSDSDSRIMHQNENGHLRLLSGVNGNGGFKINNRTDNAAYIHGHSEGAVELYHNNSKKLETTADGVSVTGDLVTSDDVIINGGASDESVLRFRDDGSESWMLRQTNADNVISFRRNSNNYLKLQANGRVDIGNAYIEGNLYLGGTGSANALYDYEKGTFTPRFHGQGNNNTITTSTNIGEYVKVGRLVYVKIRVIFTDRNGANSALAMDGLPFSNAGNHTCTNLGRWANVQNHSVVGAFSGHIGDGSQEIEFNCLTSTGASGSDVNQTTDTTTVMLGFSYPAWGQ